MREKLNIVIPAYKEDQQIVPLLDRILEEVESPVEVLVVYDSPDDSTAPVVEKYHENDPRVRPTLNTSGRGPANAIRFGLDNAQSKVAVVMMADGSDDPAQIDEMVRLVHAGNVVVAASRYMKGGRQIGGPVLKRLLSRLAGLSLYHIGRVGTHDATNSFKAYQMDFIRAVGIESDHGFELGIEMVAKARRARLRVAEVPTVWHDRTAGESRFRLLAWMPRYFRWYLYAFGRQLTTEQIRRSGVE